MNQLIHETFLQPLVTICDKLRTFDVIRTKASDFHRIQCYKRSKMSPQQSLRVLLYPNSETKYHGLCYVTQTLDYLLAVSELIS